MSIIYNLAFIILAIFYIPVLFFRRKKREGVGLRLGLYPRELIARLKGPHKNIWLHAVSVGEVIAASSLIAGLRNRYPDSRLVITTVTETGNSVARKLAGRQEIVLFLPFDISFIAKKVISRIRPSVLIITETEIWPNLIMEADSHKVPVILINGRISDKSFRGYSLIKFALKPVLEKVTLFLMQSETDRDRIISLGADASRVKVAGNMKFDSAVSVTVSEQEKKKLSSLLGLKEDEKLFLAGSTHPGEEEIILSCYVNLKDRFKNLKLLIAPRHIERTTEVAKIILQHGFKPARISHIAVSTSDERQAATDYIFLLDAIGQLKDFYSIADIVFMGGSLIKKGGQNMIEPAVFAKPVIFGPHTFNFRDIVSTFLREEAAIMVKDKKALEKAVTLLLEDPARRRRLGQKAKEVVEASKGASTITLDAIVDLTNKVGPQMSSRSNK